MASPMFGVNPTTTTMTTTRRRSTVLRATAGDGRILRRRLGIFVFVFFLLLFYSVASTFIIVYSGTLSDQESTTATAALNEHDNNVPFIPSKVTPSTTINDNNDKKIHAAAADGFSACLLVMDDNHFLSEWIAYHYFTTNLRTLIIAVDPKSLTSPSKILDLWKDRIHILQWTSDSDYMSSPTDFVKAKKDVEQYFQHTTPQLVEHRARQRLFYTQCLRTLKQMDASWTLLLDTDEFLRINYPLAAQYNMTSATMSQFADTKNASPTATNSVKVLPISQQGSVSTLLQQSTDPSVTSSVSSATEQMPLFVLQSSPCVQVPRVRFVSTDLPNNDTTSFPPSIQDTIDPNHFVTLRYRQCTHEGDLKRNKISKSLLDLRRISFEEIVPVDSIHLPIRAHCQQRRLHSRKAQSLLVVNHYMGSYKQYTYRENDARHGLASQTNTKNKNNQLRNAEQFQKAQELRHPETNSEIVSWIDGFLHDKTFSTAEELQKVLQPVGQLDHKSWRTYEGGPLEERCALLFFGLPRAFQSMVLPSITQNLLIPNARHHCDVYVHYYQQHEEAPGRRNRGGIIYPDEIFLLRDAVADIFETYGPKQGSRTQHGRLKPIVAFTQDTPEKFMQRHGKELERFRNATRADGKPLYFPWKAKTYTPTALDNMVRQWHSIEYAFKLMDLTAKQNGISYTRVGMFRSDALYLTPIDIAEMDTNVVDTSNSHFVTAPFARYPVNDRSIYGPYDAVKIWATQRFSLLEGRAITQVDPGYTMHSERFLNASVIPAMQDAGYVSAVHPDICFVRTRADDSAMVSDCTIGGSTRHWANVDPLQRVESIVGKNCTRFQMGSKWKFVGCGENVDYQDGKEKGWL